MDGILHLFCIFNSSGIRNFHLVSAVQRLKINMRSYVHFLLFAS